MSAFPAELGIEQRDGLPEEWRFMLADYPREQWMSHSALGEHARFWLSVHRHFRMMGSHLTSLGSSFREGDMTPEKFLTTLAPRLQQFLGTLDHHHRIEDNHFFPIFMEAEKRLVKGIELLEEDHHVIDAQVHHMINVANALLQTGVEDHDGLKRAGNDFADASDKIVALLHRHLDDEEEIVVPVMLDRGEVELLGG